MSYDTNTIQIKTLDSISARAPKGVINAIEQASNSSGVDFSYLVQQASAESSFNPHAEAKTSSATGLYQFIDSTWLSMVENHGNKYGLDTSGKTKQEILDMRHDPKASSFMAAAFASENEKFLNSHWGGDVSSTELYFAHFMGASGASSFLNARDENPLQNAADLFPRAARANRNVFYDRETGKPKTLEQVYQFFDKKFQIEPQDAQMNIAQAPLPPSTPARKLAQVDTASAPNQLYDVSQNAVPRDQIMERVAALRNGQTTQNNYGNVTSKGIDAADYIERRQRSDALLNKSQLHTPSARTRDESTTPFFRLLSKPVDIMALTQTAKPSKAIRYNS
ncbi:MAG: transglycosylase SLT domain-containing protein [Alphaproteobacteria bacterium]